jgi:predicted helicase
MGMGIERVGSVYANDGGIDVVAWPEKSATFPFLIAVQAKFHHREYRKTGVKAVLELQSVVRNLPFQAGILVTNTSFTPNAKWVARNRPHLVRLRDHEDLRRWIVGNFLNETEWREIPEFLEYAPGKKLWLPGRSKGL